MTPPTSTEPMYLISNCRISELVRCKYRKDREAIADGIRARGPVAEQAPVCIHFNPDEPDWQCTYTDFCKFKGCSISEFPKYVERRYCKQAQQHAALIAQEREKWERERDAEELAPFVKRKMAQAREHVLNKLEMEQASILKKLDNDDFDPTGYPDHCIRRHENDIDLMKSMTKDVIHFIKSLRSEVKK